MEIRPSESPIYGGVPIELEFSVELCPEAEHNLPHAFYLVFEGSRARHVCRAQLIHQSNNGRLLLLTTAPPHDRVEETKLRAFYRGHLGTRPVLFHTTQFQFVSDAAYQVASTLIRTQLSNTSSLILERVIKGRLELRTQMHCLRRVDRRLAAAFRAIQKPERWTIAPLATTNRTSNNNNNKDESETLLHLASRMGLSELCEYLLCCPGSLVALKTPNSQGSLPQDLARQNGYDKLSEKLANYRSSSCVKSENPLLYDCVISEGRDHCLPPTITTNLLSDHQPDEVSDIDRLEELIASVERVVSPMPLMSYGAAVGAANDFNINYPTSTTIEQSSQTGVSQEAHRKQQNSVNGNADGQMCQDGDTSGSQQITQALGHIEDNHAAQDSKKEVLRRPSFCRLSSSCPSIPHHLVHGAAAAGAAGQGTVGVHSSYSQAEIHPVSTHHGQTSSSASTISSAGITPLTSSSLQQQEQPGSQLPRASTSTGHHKQLPMHPDNEATRLMVNSKKSSVSSSALDSVALRSSPAGDDDDDEAVNNVKILVNDITPASSQEFLQASNPSSRRSSASDVRHSPFQGNSIGGNTAQRLAKRSQLQSQNSESSRRQSWTDLSKTDAIISQTDIIGGITLPLLHGTHDSPKTVNNRRAHKSPIKLQRSVSLNSLKSAGVCDGGGPDSASNSSSELHTSSTNKGAPPTSSATSDSSTTASGNTISLQTDISRISAENQTTVGGSAGVSRLAVAAPGAGKPPSGAFSSSHSNLTTTSSTYAGGGSTQAGSPIVSQSSAIGIPAGNVTAGIGGSDALHRGQLPPLQLLPSSEHNYSMQPPPSPRQHRSASSGETMLLLHRCQEDMPQQSAQTGALAAPSSGAQSGGPPPVPPKFAKPLPPGVLSKKLPPPSLQKSVSTPSIVVAQETLLQHSQSDRSATGRPVAAAGLLNSHGSHGGLGGNVASAADSDDEKFIGKRTKKRGSLFFRKKKVSKNASTASQGALKETATRAHTALALSRQLKCITDYTTSRTPPPSPRS